MSTDNKALKHIFDPNANLSNIAANRLVRWSIILNAYDYNIEFKPTALHGNADMLSRLPLKQSTKVSSENLLYHYQISSLPVTAATLRTETLKDNILNQVLKFLATGKWPAKHDVTEDLKPFFYKRLELSLDDGIILWNLRVIIPRCLEDKILQELHHQHPGIVRMKELSRIHAWFPGIDARIEKLVKSCPNCAKVANWPPKCKPHPWDWPTGPMDRIHLDFFGPFYGSCCLVMVDSYSGWIEAREMKSTKALNTVDVLRSWFYRFGISKQIITDNGPQFTSGKFKDFTRMNGIKHITSPAYHQQSNGAAERCVQTLKKALKSNNVDSSNIDRKLQNFLLVGDGYTRVYRQI